jgi:valyl-tRNA synthetase
MDKRYDHRQHEQKIYQLWEEAGVFNPDRQQAAKNKSFCVIMPPPNANDPLHIGHAMFVAIEDTLIRYHRMLGEDTLWLPGTDHAGIETQYVFEKKLQKQNRSRFDFDRETLFQKIWDYVQEKSDVATDQIKKLGASCDWSRYKFTLDKDVVESVLKTFKKLHDDGLVYRDYRLVNYCTECGTAFSELEVEHQEQTSKLYYIKYGPLTVATTRPETKFADVALAVHPEDKRYQNYIGKTIEARGLFKTYHLPVIADDFVDPKFGTGVVKITPYHDQADFDFWEKHQNEIPQQPQTTINYEGRLTELAGPYSGQKAHTAREQIVTDLKKAGLLEKIDNNYQHTLGVCYRCKHPIEPLPLTQFYIKTKPLIKPIQTALKQKKIKVYGAGHDKILAHWLEILQDWNISRQIVWGIRLPVWYQVEKNPDIRVVYINPHGEKVSGKLEELLKNATLAEIKNGLQSLSAPLNSVYEVSLSSPGENYIQETDTFDTWFSSSQWPVVALQNNKPGDFERFYPTNLMETGYDILMFWVMRMLMMGHYLTGELPFSDIYLHGLIRDEKGEKMSKSKGNVINPLEITNQYGADALRMALVIRSTPGLDKSVGRPDFKAARNLTNKIWNAARFILLNLDENKLGNEAEQELDTKFYQHLKTVAAEVTRQLDQYKLGLAAETLYNEFWHWFCDECIEQAKQDKLSQTALLNGLKTFLKLLHPFIPFVTEKLWLVLSEKGLTDKGLLISQSWPQKNY